MSIDGAKAGIVLTVRERPHVPVEAELLTPNHTAKLSHAELRALPVVMGKRQQRLDDFFLVEGAASDDIEIQGDVGRVKWIGRGMTHGRIRIHGNAGMHLGSGMKGGVIEVAGNASDWIGAEMRGGLIHIHGDVGGQIGAAYRGSLRGMNGGTILIDGGAGLELGMRMRRGVIAVKGRVKDFAGLQMKGGTIILGAGAEIRTGAWMVRGTIISLAPLRMMPTFTHTTDYNPTFIRLYDRFLAPHGFRLPIDSEAGVYRRYSGDTSVPGQGEILIWNPRT